jgi:hypothetical protein
MFAEYLVFGLSLALIAGLLTHVTGIMPEDALTMWAMLLALWVVAGRSSSRLLPVAGINKLAYGRISVRSGGLDVRRGNYPASR